MSVSTQVNADTRLGNGRSSPTSDHSSTEENQTTYNVQTKSNIFQETPGNVKDASFNISMNNSSGLGDSISLPCLSADCSSSSSSIYGGSNTVNAVHSSSDSMPETPTSPSAYASSTGTDCQSLLGYKNSQKQDLSGQKTNFLNNPKSSDSNLDSKNNYSQFGNYINQMNNLNLNQFDYDPFNDYMGMDKMISSSDGQKSKANLSLDSHQQQQMIAQALAAVASNSNSEQQQGCNTKASTRSLTENIEMLNSKFQSFQSNKNFADKSNDKNSESCSMNNFLSSMSSQNFPQNNQDSQSQFNFSANLKRQSYPASNQLGSSGSNFNNGSSGASNHSSVQSVVNNRLNSTPNLYGANDSSNFSGNRSFHNASIPEKQLSNSFSASNSTFDFNLSSKNCDNDTAHNGSRGMNQFNLSANSNSSNYEDDDVFSANTSFSSPSLNQQNKQNENNKWDSQNFDTVALAQLYRNILNNNGNSNNGNKIESSGSGNSTNINELLASYNANIAALTMNPDLINSASFLNSTNLMATQLKNLNMNSSNSQSVNNGHGQSNNSNSRGNNSSAANLDHITAAVLKQRQMMNSNRGSSSNLNGNSNIAALTSATSNIASLLNLNNSNNSPINHSNSQSSFDSNLKRRSLNSSNFSALNNGGNLGQSHSNYNSQSSLYSNNVGPNASHLLQNSSLASSARLNTGTSSSAAASVLGNNSSLHQTLSSLQHQSSSGLSGSQNNHNIFNSNSTSSNNNNSGNGGNLQHQSNLLNFNMPGSASSNHGILSALSLSSTAGNSLQSQLLSASGKPLRSERLPSHIVDEIVKQAKIRRRNGGKKEVCVFCRNNGEKEQIYTSHTLKDASNHVACPILRLYQCPICHASGDQAHTIKYCPYAEKDNNCIKLFKENGRMSSAAAFLMNSLAGGNTSPTLSPPMTPPLSHQMQNQSMLSQNMSLDMQSPSNHQNSLNAYLNSSFNYNLGSGILGKNNEISSNLNKSFGSNCSSMLNSSSSLSNTAAANAANSVLTSRDANSSLLSSNFANQLGK